MDIEPVHPDAQKATNFIIAAVIGLGLILFLAVMWAFNSPSGHQCDRMCDIPMGQPYGGHEGHYGHHGHHDGMMPMPYGYDSPMPYGAPDGPYGAYDGPLGGPAVDVMPMPGYDQMGPVEAVPLPERVPNGYGVPQGQPGMDYYGPGVPNVDPNGVDWGYAVPMEQEPFVAPEGDVLMNDPRFDWDYAVEVPEGAEVMTDPMMGVPEVAADPADAFIPREPNFSTDGSGGTQTCEAMRVDPMTGEVLERVTFAC